MLETINLYIIVNTFKFLGALMSNKLRADAYKIFNESIEAVKPEKAVKEALQKSERLESITLIAIGKAAWRMARAAGDILGKEVKQGVVITKYGHGQGNLKGITIYEAGHPLSDENTLEATKHAISMVECLTQRDTVLMLISGGGSALFEYPLEGITLKDIVFTSDLLLKAGADITEINTIRKRLSSVKAGRFAQLCQPAKIVSLILSDVLGNRLDTIASGPIYSDETTVKDAINIIEKYDLDFPPHIIEALKKETPKSVEDIETKLVGNVEKLCEAARQSAINLGYNTEVISTHISDDVELCALAILEETRKWIERHKQEDYKQCFIYGGEMVVKVTGDGLGGRCQHFALKIASLLHSDEQLVILAAGSDGTDGPTDAAGAVIDSSTLKRLETIGYNIDNALQTFDAYHALAQSEDLLITGPTGTNANDLILILIENKLKS